VENPAAAGRVEQHGGQPSCHHDAMMMMAAPTTVGVGQHCANSVGSAASGDTRVHSCAAEAVAPRQVAAPVQRNTESPGFSNRVVCRHAAVATEAAVGPRGSSAVLGVYHVFCCAPWDAPAPVLCVKGGGRRAHSRRWCLCRDVIQGMRARCRRPQCAAPRRRSDGSGAAAAWGGAQQEWKVGG